MNQDVDGCLVFQGGKIQQSMNMYQDVDRHLKLQDIENQQYMNQDVDGGLVFQGGKIQQSMNMYQDVDGHLVL